MERKIVSPPTYRRAKSLGNILVRARVPSGFPIWREYLYRKFSRHETQCYNSSRSK